MFMYECVFVYMCMCIYIYIDHKQGALLTVVEVPPATIAAVAFRSAQSRVAETGLRSLLGRYAGAQRKGILRCLVPRIARHLDLAVKSSDLGPGGKKAIAVCDIDCEDPFYKEPFIVLDW